jgi:hypothetical protein
MATPDNSNLAKAGIGFLPRFIHRGDSLTQIRLRVGIPKTYHQEPVISQLTANYGLLVNITGAMLGEDTSGQGWFDLELRGTPNQIQSGLAYLQELELKIWGRPNADGDGWHY